MGNIKRLTVIQDAAERFGLPSDALGAIRLSLCGNSSLLAENHRGILEYSDSRLVLAADRNRVVISGAELSIAAMKGDTLLLCGKIQSVEMV